MNDLLQIAFTQYGIAEIPGEKANPEITKYFTEIGFEAEKLNEATSWCSAFVNWVGLKANKDISGVEDKIFILGGNQSNAVNISAYLDIQLLEYRRL